MIRDSSIELPGTTAAPTTGDGDTGHGILNKSPSFSPGGTVHCTAPLGVCTASCCPGPAPLGTTTSMSVCVDMVAACGGSSHACRYLCIHHSPSQHTPRHTATRPTRSTPLARPGSMGHGAAGGSFASQWATLHATRQPMHRHRKGERRAALTCTSRDDEEGRSRRQHTSSKFGTRARREDTTPSAACGCAAIVPYAAHLQCAAWTDIRPTEHFRVLRAASSWLAGALCRGQIWEYRIQTPPLGPTCNRERLYGKVGNWGCPIDTA